VVRSVDWRMDKWATDYHNINASGFVTEQKRNNHLQLCVVLNYRRGFSSCSRHGIPRRETPGAQRSRCKKCAGADTKLC
jgi:hypothetical protein